MADADSRGHKVNKVHKKKTMCRKMHYKMKEVYYSLII